MCEATRALAPCVVGTSAEEAARQFGEMLGVPREALDVVHVDRGGSSSTEEEVIVLLRPAGGGDGGAARLQALALENAELRRQLEIAQETLDELLRCAQNDAAALHNARSAAAMWQQRCEALQAQLQQMPLPLLPTQPTQPAMTRHMLRRQHSLSVALPPSYSVPPLQMAAAASAGSRSRSRPSTPESSPVSSPNSPIYGRCRVKECACSTFVPRSDTAWLCSSCGHTSVRHITH